VSWVLSTPESAGQSCNCPPGAAPRAGIAAAITLAQEGTTMTMRMPKTKTLLVTAAALLGLVTSASAEPTRSRRGKRGSAALATIPVREAAPAAPDAMARLGERARASAGLELRKKSARKPDYVEYEVFTVERLSQTQIEDTIRAHLSDLASCHERYAGHSSSVGSVTIALTVEPSGVVSAASIDGFEGPAKLGTCMARAARTWSFPAADGETEVRYPLAFGE